MSQYIGLDVSLKETAITVRENGRKVWRGKCASDPKLLADVIRQRAPCAVRVVFETGPLSVRGCSESYAKPCPFVARRLSDGLGDIDRPRSVWTSDRHANPRLWSKAAGQQSPILGRRARGETILIADIPTPPRSLFRSSCIGTNPPSTAVSTNGKFDRKLPFASVPQRIEKHGVIAGERFA